MLFRCLIVIFLIALHPSPARAHPPSDITLHYNATEQKLLIEIAHVSRDRLQHYIYKIEVRKNDLPPETHYYRQQVQPSGFDVEIPLSAEEGDLITVTAYSRKGGKRETTLEITPEILEAETPIRKTAQRAAAPIPQDPEKIRPAVSRDPDVAKPAVPRSGDRVRPAVLTDHPSAVAPVPPREASIVRPAVTKDTAVAKPPIPEDPSKIKPALPSGSSFTGY